MTKQVSEHPEPFEELSDEELRRVSGGRPSSSLVMYSTDGKPVARYHLSEAWPSTIQH
jgi:bacteriocin-like protein